MNIKLNKEHVEVIGKAGLKIGKAIIIEGTKAVLAKGTTAMIMEGFDNGIDGIKNMTLDEFIGKKNKEAKKKSVFKRKKKEVDVDSGITTETVIETTVTEVETEEA